jgi:phosphatidylglycerol:prolipoprotein diacylglycerol transferase
MLALAVGRIGCFLNGCCYGKVAPSWLPFKVTYPPAMMPLELAGMPLYPAPIYESITAAAIFIFLAWRAAHKKFEGEIFWLMVLIYAVARFFLEFLRADERGGIDALHMSTSQLIGVALFLLSGVLLIRGYLKPGAKRAGN